MLLQVIMVFRSIIKAARLRHWVKNILVFFPALFAGRILDPACLRSSSLVFLSFCFAASAVYVFNDLYDANRDRANPARKNRPIASGEMSEQCARCLFVTFLIIAAVLQLPVSSAPAAAVIALYVVVNIAYSYHLKHVPIVDVCALASGYLLRVYCGALACDISVSSWLYLTVLSGSFYLGLGKRRGEILSNGSGSRPVLSRYGLAYLDKNIYLFLGLTNVFYALWARDAMPGMLATVPLAMVLSMRYSLDIERASCGDPMEMIATDKWLIVIATALIVMMVVFVYAVPNI